MSILELMASPVVVQVAGTSAVKCDKKQPSKCGKGDSGEIILCKGRDICQCPCEASQILLCFTVLASVFFFFSKQKAEIY